MLDHSNIISITTLCEEETSQIAEDIGISLGQGSLVLLSGDLGVGKTVVARSLIHQLSNNWDQEVTSPTYNICQTYSGKTPIAHFDLYRITDRNELDELGWQDYLETGCVIFEWPENCFDPLPQESVLITILDMGNNKRHMNIHANPVTLEKIRRSFDIRSFLDSNEMVNCKRRFLSGDASTRSYEILGDGDKLLMNAPESPDGPAIHDGKPYSKIAHLAENVTAFVAIDQILREQGVMAPEIFAEDIDRGLLILEHFGTEGIIDAQQNPVCERYLVAIEFLADLHQKNPAAMIALKDGADYNLPHYDHDAMMIEASLFFDWYLPDATDKNVSRKEFETIWTDLIHQSMNLPHGLVLRDFHSPNILWLDARKGTERIGVIDFQDALIGPLAYDVAAIAQDARVDISMDFEEKLLQYYIESRTKSNPDFNASEFLKAYALMSALRTTKILGIFVRLDIRDGKPQYRQHLPRMKDYLHRSLRHPVLETYRLWLENVIKL